MPQFPALLDQNQEHLHSLRFQCDDLIPAEKKMSIRIEAEPAEFVNDSWLIHGFWPISRAHKFKTFGILLTSQLTGSFFSYLGNGPKALRKE